MPELPEVETVVRELNQALPGQRVRSVEVFRKDALGAVTPKAFAAALSGRQFGTVGRHGKFLLFRLQPEGYLIAHLRMTGKFIISPPLAKPDPHHRVWFHLENGKTLVFQDMRCFGTLHYVDRLDESSSLAKLGVDPYAPEFSADWLAARLKESRTPLKHWLMDQKHIAGIGNIYASEVLFRTGLSPRKPSHRVTAQQAQALHKNIRAILDQAILKNGTTISDFRRVDEKLGEFQRFLKVYGKEHEPCPKCGQLIKRIRQQQRSTFYCTTCQK
jgi:formamidopyrimidine-DNA glycosylase